MKDSTIFIYSAPSVVAVAIRAFYSAITSEIDRLRHIHGAIKCTNFTPQQIHGFLPQKKWFLFRLLIIKSEEDPYRLYSVFAKGGNCNKERALKKGAREKSDNGNKERKKASKGEFSLGKKATHTHIAFASSEWVMRIMWSAATHSFFFLFDSFKLYNPTTPNPNPFSGFILFFENWIILWGWGSFKWLQMLQDSSSVWPSETEL